MYAWQFLLLALSSEKRRRVEKTLLSFRKTSFKLFRSMLHPTWNLFTKNILCNNVFCIQGLRSFIVTNYTSGLSSHGPARYPAAENEIWAYYPDDQPVRFLPLMELKEPNLISICTCKSCTVQPLKPQLLICGLEAWARFLSWVVRLHHHELKEEFCADGGLLNQIVPHSLPPSDI